MEFCTMFLQFIKSYKSFCTVLTFIISTLVYFHLVPGQCLFLLKRFAALFTQKFWWVLRMGIQLMFLKMIFSREYLAAIRACKKELDIVFSFQMVLPLLTTLIKFVPTKFTLDHVQLPKTWPPTMIHLPIMGKKIFNCTKQHSTDITLWIW